MASVPSYWPARHFAPRYFAPSYFGGAGAIAAALLPNPRRTLRPVVPGYAGRDFAAMTPDQSEVNTFNLTVLLYGRAILDVRAFTIEAADAVSALIDPSPMSRLVAGPSIDDTDNQLSVRIGNLMGITGVVRYRLSAVVEDSGNNVFEIFAGLPVAPRGDPFWTN